MPDNGRDPELCKKDAVVDFNKIRDDKQALSNTLSQLFYSSQINQFGYLSGYPDAFIKLTNLLKPLLYMVGTERFELSTPSTPCWCATRLRYAPTIR